MKVVGLCAACLILVIPLGAIAAEGESTTERIKENAAEAGRVIKRDAVKAGQAIKEGAVEVGQAAQKGAAAVGDGANKVATKAKRKVAVARCQDGAYSYTSRDTCSEHGGVKERLR